MKTSVYFPICVVTMAVVAAACASTHQHLTLTNDGTELYAFPRSNDGPGTVIAIDGQNHWIEGPVVDSGITPAVATIVWISTQASKTFSTDALLDFWGAASLGGHVGQTTTLNLNLFNGTQSSITTTDLDAIAVRLRKVHLDSNWKWMVINSAIQADSVDFLMTSSVRDSLGGGIPKILNVNASGRVTHISSDSSKLQTKFPMRLNFLYTALRVTPGGQYQGGPGYANVVDRSGPVTTILVTKP